MTFKELNQRLKNGILDNLYLFYGSEDYIKESYVKKIIQAALKDDALNINLTQFDEMPDKNELSEAIESAPILSDKKVVLLNSLNIISTTAKKDIKEFLCDRFEDLPPYTIVIIKESENDIRKFSKPVINLIKKKGVEILCDNPDYSDILAFANRQFRKHDKKILKSDLEYFLSICDNSLNAIISEIDKICSYLSDSDIVDKKTIDLMVKKSIEDRVFGLSDAIISKNKMLAYEILSDLMLLKNQHPSGKIFSIICDHFINLFIIMNNSKNRIPNNITLNLAEIQGRAFLINKYLRQSQNIDIGKLKNVLVKLNLLDYKIKNGLIEPYYAIEEIIATF